MSRSSAAVWLVIAILLFSLPGCRRSASPLPEVLPTFQGDSLILPNPAQSSIGATQTGVAAALPATQIVSATPNPTRAGSTSAPLGILASITPQTPTATPEGIIVPTLDRPARYTLQAGETPYCIARRFNVDIGELLSLNSLTSESLPAAGTALRIPSSGHSWSSGVRWLLAHPASYTVRHGDTLPVIACLFGDVSPEAIAVVNQLALTDPLAGGTVLQIP